MPAEATDSLSTARRARDDRGRKGLRALLRSAGLSAKALTVGAGEVRVVLTRALVEKAIAAR